MNYFLTNEAELDLSDIYDYSYSKFGAKTSNQYFDRLILSFQRISEFPGAGIKRPELGNNIRSMIHQSHLIFYTVQNGSILIIRILHHSRDIEEYL